MSTRIFNRRARHLATSVLLVSALFSEAVFAATLALTNAAANSAETQLTVTGANFSTSGNTVLFGAYGNLAIVSQNATTIVATLPAPAVAPGSYITTNQFEGPVRLTRSDNWRGGASRAHRADGAARRYRSNGVGGCAGTGWPSRSCRSARNFYPLR